jgi:hypothetical protein
MKEQMPSIFLGVINENKDFKKLTHFQFEKFPCIFF